MPNAHAEDLLPLSNQDGIVRIHAFEFGTATGGADAGTLKFHDLRVTDGFPASAVRRARLGGLDVRAKDLWRLVHPAAGDGALLVWPASPACTPVRMTIDGPAACGSPAMRVISLIRVDFPDVRAARWRASLKARSIAVAEEDWRRYAPALVTQAPTLLRTGFETIVATGSRGGLRFAGGIVAAQRCAHGKASPAELLLRSIRSRQPLLLGQDDVGSESEFWALAAEVLAALPAEARGDLSFASGFASPFAPEAVRYVPWRRPLAECATGLPGAVVMDELCDAKSGRNEAPDDLVRDIARYLGDEAGEIARQLEENNRQSPPSVPLLDAIASTACRLPVEAPLTALRERLLDKCEDDLIRCFAANGFLGEADLRRLLASPALAALVRRAIERRPHAIVARLQVSLTLLAHSGPDATELLDDCLRTLLPPRWPANEWLSQFEEDWAVQRALAALRRARVRLPGAEFVNLERACLDRLSCTTFAAERSRRLDVARTAPQVLAAPMKHPA